MVGFCVYLGYRSQKNVSCMSLPKNLVNKGHKQEKNMLDVRNGVIMDP